MQPQGAAVDNFVIRLALSMVSNIYHEKGIHVFCTMHTNTVQPDLSYPDLLDQVASESVKVYKAINEGSLNLVDKVRC